MKSPVSNYMPMEPSGAAAVEQELEKSWYEPGAAELRKLYREKREALRRSDTRFTMWVAIAIYVGFGALDFLLIPDVAPLMASARALLAVPTIAIIEALARKGATADRIEGFCASMTIVSYVLWLGIACLSQHTTSMSYYMVFGSIFMMVASLFFNFRLLSSVTASALILAMFFCAILFVIPVSTPYALAFGTFYVSCFAVTSFVNWKLNVERYRVFLNELQAEIRQTEVIERGKDLLRLSNTDPLTGLDNRRAIDGKLRQYWEAWQGGNVCFGVMLIDIDFFKRYNDYYGHQAGDNCLITVAGALARVAADRGGVIGRYGGEEFILLVPARNRDAVAAAAEEVRRAVSALKLPHQHRRDGEAIVTASVGAAFTRDQAGPKLEKLVNEADRALYAAKASGRNCAQLFDPDDPQRNDESENIAALLRIAIAEGLVSMVYQPIRNVATGEIEAAEALMRLRMLDGTAVPPSLFIPIAERTGAIIELGKWAIRTVCREILADGRLPLVSVNVSAVQLKMPGFAASVAAVLGELGITGNRLAFEVTEGLEIEMHSDVLRSIAELKQLGIRIWLDDFGTGFAGLSWLRIIDFDTVKIDRSFLHDCSHAKGRSMLQDIVGLIRNRGHNILVEGVETQEQVDLMREFGIGHIQGYHIGRPGSAECLRGAIEQQARLLPKAIRA